MEPGPIGRQHWYHCLLLLYAKMLKETEIALTINFAFIIFMIFGISIAEDKPIVPFPHYGYAYDFWPVDLFSFLI